MRREVSTGELRWMHIADPEEDDLRFLHEKLGFHALDVEECRRPSLRPKVESHPEYLFLVVHVPAHQKEERVTIPIEYDIFVASNLIVTVHAASASHLDELFQQASSSEDVKQRVIGRGAAYLLYRILDHLFEAAFPMLDHITENLVSAEKKVFSGHERQMVFELSLIHRDLEGFRSIVRPQRHLYEAGTLHGDWGSQAFTVVFRSMHGKLTRLWDHLETLWERAETLGGTNAVLVNYKLNEFVKILTMLGAFFLPLGLVAQVAVFLHDGIPLSNRILFWGIITVMLLVVYVTLWNAKRRKIL
ncbi:MAG: CorA family divalent cation transporter [bacterium]|nr:CorA family divalent cation transporter [bacterium]